MPAQYAADTEAAVASAAATTAKTIFGVKGDSGHGVLLKSWWLDFDGVASAEKPILVEFCYVTWATNAPGTNSTAVTVDQFSGRAIAETFAAGRNWTSEPTTITPLITFDYDPFKGFYERDYALGDEPDTAVAEGFCWRLTVPSGGAAVNYRMGARWARA